jgi:putative ABC transport system substrate-binding protein
VAIDMETDPVQTGLIGSYARPGGNVTGLFLDMPTLASKWIELMREMVPALGRIAFAWQPSTGRSQLDVALGVAKTLNIEATVLEFDVSDDFAASLSGLTGPKQTGNLRFPAPPPSQRNLPRRQNDITCQLFRFFVQRRKADS